ncbi:hypothetical protein [uncultured Flavobacterium sp.]|uniref:hypothetical protein n=1 Tax=uncultured Flavobacterium sp. TaxID=165435 RepID=UPI0030EEABF9|tara:strand:- start:1325 stop:1735 length:411 start_codon:yes stop_codon:yes gene_type:complete
MKRIKFTGLGFKKNLDTVIVIIGIICLIIGLIAGFGYIDNRYMGLGGLSTIFTLYPQYKSLFYKNHFIWNKKGGNIKINSKSKNIIFSELDSFEFSESQLIIAKKNKTQLDFSLNDINHEDIRKLKEIIAKYIKNK